MKTKKILALILTLAMFASAAFTFALNVAADDLVNIDLATIEPMPMPTVPIVNSEPEYGFVEGIIKDIQDNIVTVEHGDSKFKAIITDSTFFISTGKTDRKAMSVGDSIRVYYDNKAPMLMIYPPQYNAEFVALNLAEANSIMIARFDKDFVDPKNTLKLNISKDTLIVYQDGTEFTGKPEELLEPSRKLIVIYNVTTRSIPAQTTPEKIIILYEKAVAPIHILTDEEKAAISAGFEKADIVINNKKIDAPKPFLNDGGILMVPVRAIAEEFGELGLPTTPVLWFDDTKTVQIGMSLSFSIGQDAYSFARMAPVSLGTAPIIKNDRTYVPIDLFGMVLPGGLGSLNYHFANGQIIIEIEPPADVAEADADK